MRLFSPGALWFLLLIPLLILMYILKQKFEEREISSLYLWQQVLMDSEATSPFQKMRKNLLFFLQLLIILLAIFALTNPFVWWKNRDYQNIIVVIDTSGSMSAVGEKHSRLEEGKKKAEDMINSLASGSKVTLISSGGSAKVEVSASRDKREVLNKLRALEKSNSAGDIEQVYSLVKAISNQYESYKAVYFTDSEVDLKDLNGEIVYLGSERSNVSLDYIAHSGSGDGLKVMIRISNHSSEAAKVELCLYGENKLLDLMDVELMAEETKTVYFDNVQGDHRYIYGEITQRDALAEDNIIYSIVKQNGAAKVLLSTDKNTFLEKALTSLKDVELYKTLPKENITGEFDLYIFDGETQEELPKRGNMLFINPLKDNEFYNLSSEVSGGKASVEPHGVTKYMENSSFIISKLRPLNQPYWASNLIKVGEQTAALAGEYRGQKIGVISFALQNSDLPLTPEFPILINNLISYLTDRDIISNSEYSCGEGIEIVPMPEAEKIYVINPQKNKLELSAQYPVKPFDKTNTPGIYEITQKLGEQEDSRLVAVNFPAAESRIVGGGLSSDKTIRSGTSRGGININSSLIILALLFLTIEWIVYIKS